MDCATAADNANLVCDVIETPTIQVLLATYNGAAYVEEQLQSVLEQSFRDFEILVADDGSTDDTIQLIEKFQVLHPKRIRIVFRSRVAGAARNFMRLTKVCTAPYVMYCDQDDVWHADKIQRLLDACRTEEATRPETPVLVHSDLTVVDSSLQVINRSMFDYQHIDPACVGVGQLALNSVVTGCSLLMNRQLALLIANDDPDSMAMHDWWISLAAAGFGSIQCVAEPTVLYRQHGTNAIGAKPPGGVDYFASRVWSIARGGRRNRNLRKAFRQAHSFMLVHGDRLRPEDRHALNFYAALALLGPIRLRYALIRHKVLKQSWLRNLITILVV